MHVPKPYEVTIVCILFIVCCTVFLGLRLYGRKLKAMSWGWDDALTISSWAVVIGLCSLLLYDSFYGHLDLAVGEMPKADRTAYLKRLLAEGIMTYLSLALTKISIIAFYLRIFNLSNFKLFRPWAYATIAFTLAWFLAALFTTLFSDGPNPATLWEGSKGPLPNWYPSTAVALAVLDIVLDLWILCLPVPIVWGLQMTMRRRLAVLGIFWLGIFCIVASLMRLYYIVLRFEAPNIALMTPAQSINVLVNTSIWGVVEPSCSLIAACLPTLGNLFTDDWNIYKPFQAAANWLERTFSSVSSLLSGGTRTRTTREGSTASSFLQKEQRLWDEQQKGTKSVDRSRPSTVEEV